MFKAKDIVIKSIDSKTASEIVKRNHYSGKVTNNSQIHFGVFLGGTLQGALQFGASIDKRRMAQNLGVGFNETLELNRMALSDQCPPNSESRALGICLRILKKAYPHLRVIVSFADACQCGDGTIYRASGFKLHSFKKNNSLLHDPEGKVHFNHGGKKYKGGVIAKKSLDDHLGEDGKYLSSSLKKQGLVPIEGFQMKYLYFFDKELEKRFKFVDFADIPQEVRMYKGKKIRAESKEIVATGFQPVEGGENPTSALQNAEEIIK